MLVTVCELPNHADALEEAWGGLCSHTQERGSQLVLLPEMPFAPWLAEAPEPVPEAWAEAIHRHERWIQRLPELGARTVVATMPVVDGESRFNEGFVWERASGMVRAVHRKRYLPDEPGFWEASWYSPGDVDFPVHEADGTRIGFSICTEIWFHDHARRYASDGVHILACPRATLAPSVSKWIAGGRAAAVVSGAFSLSSNFSGPTRGGGELGDWGGSGWIVEPEEGEVLGVTSRREPFVTVDIDLAVAERAKSTYPRYVLE